MVFIILTRQINSNINLNSIRLFRHGPNILPTQHTIKFNNTSDWNMWSTFYVDQKIIVKEVKWVNILSSTHMQNFQNFKAMTMFDSSGGSILPSLWTFCGSFYSTAAGRVSFILLQNQCHRVSILNKKCCCRFETLKNHRLLRAFDVTEFSN